MKADSRAYSQKQQPTNSPSGTASKSHSGFANGVPEHWPLISNFSLTLSAIPLSALFFFDFRVLDFQRFSVLAFTAAGSAFGGEAPESSAR
jgi:hypothetical protein